MFRFAQHDIFRTILYLFLPFRPTLHSLSRYWSGIDRVSIGYGLAQGGIERNQSPNRDQIWTKIWLFQERDGWGTCSEWKIGFLLCLRLFMPFSFCFSCRPVRKWSNFSVGRRGGGRLPRERGRYLSMTPCLSVHLSSCSRRSRCRHYNRLRTGLCTQSRGWDQ